jgi:hypothetical protein
MSERYGYAPDPGTVTPYPGAPAFFVRAYDLGRSFVAAFEHPDAQGRRDLIIQRLYGPDAGILPIWGFACRSEYAEDAASEKWAFEQNRSFLAWCFSSMEPRGEIGFVPLDEVVEVSREEFDIALDKLRKR